MSLTLKIVSPREVIYDGSVDFCEIPAESGIEGVLPGHVNFISNVSKGAVKYKIGENVQEIDISGGFVEISNNFINILVND